MTNNPKFTSSSQSSFDAPDDAEKYVLATIPTEESNGLLPTILLVSLLLLIGVISLLWVSLGRPAVPFPTPTATATEAATTVTTDAAIESQSATPDQRATELVMLMRTRAASDLANDRPDLATIVAMLVSDDDLSSDLILTPAPSIATPISVAQEATATSLPDDKQSTYVPVIKIPAEATATSINDPAPTATIETVISTITTTVALTATTAITAVESISIAGSNIQLPIIVGPNEETPVPTATAEPTATPTEEPTTVITPTIGATATLTITATLTPTVEAVETPTAAPTAEPTEAPTPTPTDVPILVALKGKVASGLGDVDVYKGPSRTYDTVGKLSAGQDLNISDRDPSGEWLYICCSDTNASGWVRQVDAPPTGNLLSDIIGTEAALEVTSTPEADRDVQADDVRWLRVRNVPANPAPPAWPAIPADHYVLSRYNPGNQANGPLPQLIKAENLPAEGIFIEAWSPKSRAQGAILTSAAATERGAYITSEDGNLYQLRLDNGEGIANYNFGSAPDQVNVPLAIFDQTIYAASSGNEIFAINEQGLEIKWSSQLIEPASRVALTPITGINVLGTRLYLGATDGTAQYLLSVDRNNEGALEFAAAIAGNSMQFPAIGNQLIYVGNEYISAIDAEEGSIVWEQKEPQNISAPPIYSAPGILALAELYVAADEKLFALDANTGEKIWSVAGGGPISGLALGDTVVYASIGTEVKSFDRTDGIIKWTMTTNSQVLGGPYVNGDRMIVVTSDGFIHYLNTLDGSTVFKSEFVGDNARNAPAITNKYIFIPGDNNKVFTWQGGE